MAPVSLQDRFDEILKEATWHVREVLAHAGIMNRDGEEDEKVKQKQFFLMFMVTFMTVTTVATKFLNPLIPDDKKKEMREKDKSVHDTKTLKEKQKEKEEKKVGAQPAAEEEEDTEKERPRTRAYTPYVILVFAAVRWILSFIWPEEQTHITCLDDQPMVSRTEYFLSSKVFSEMQSKLHRLHPLVAPGAKHYDTGVSEGFSVSFTQDGISLFEENADLKIMHPFFKKAVVADASAWTLRLVISNHSKFDEEAVKLHQDSFKGFNGTDNTFVAHQVNILYVSVPENMDGGRLFLYKNVTMPSTRVQEPWGGIHAASSQLQNSHQVVGGASSLSGVADEEIEPEENMMVEFRGDSYHRVSGFKSAGTESRRIAVVLEQYLIQDTYLKYCLPFTFEEFEQ